MRGPRRGFVDEHVVRMQIQVQQAPLLALRARLVSQLRGCGQSGEPLGQRTARAAGCRGALADRRRQFARRSSGNDLEDGGVTAVELDLIENPRSWQPGCSRRGRDDLVANTLADPEDDLPIAPAGT